MLYLNFPMINQIISLKGMANGFSFLFILFYIQLAAKKDFFNVKRINPSKISSFRNWFYKPVKCFHLNESHVLYKTHKHVKILIPLNNG